MLIIGSAALRHWGVRLDRKTVDIDIIGTFNEYNAYVNENRENIVSCWPTSSSKFLITFKREYFSSKLVEWEIAWEGSSGAALLELVKERPSLEKIGYACPHIIYALKMSHRFLKDSPHFLKTMEDIHLLRTAGYRVLPDFLNDWLTLREKETYKYDHPRLNVKAEDFFKKEETFYKYNHDDIHEAVKLGDKPAYTYFLAVGEPVLCDKNRFFGLHWDTKINSVLEEAYTLALERSLIPFDFKPHPKDAFEIALKKVCTSVTSGWWRDFAWEHYNEVLGRYDAGYWLKFVDALEEGNIREFKR